MQLTINPATTTTHRESPQETAHKSNAKQALDAVASGAVPVATRHRQPRSLDERFRSDVSEWTTYSVGRFPITLDQFTAFSADRDALVAFLTEESERQWIHSPQYCGCVVCQDRSGYRWTVEYQLSRGQTPSAKLLALANG